MPRIAVRSPLLPPLLTGSLLCDERGHPRYWASVWLTLYGGNLTVGTLEGKLAVIERLYRLTEEFLGTDCLDDLLADGDFKAVQPILEAFFVRTRNHALMSRTNGARDWEVAQTFVTQIVSGIAGTISTPSQLAQAPTPLTGASVLKFSAHLQGMRAPEAARKRPIIRALPAEVVDGLLEVLDPSSAKNPFRTEDQRWRNYAMFLLYLQQGLRRGEALLLSANAINEGIDPKTGEVLLWMNVEEIAEDDEDLRHVQPSIKTETSRRQIPISRDVATVIEHYVINYRGKQNHRFLFCSNQRRPLALNTVNLVFKRASNALSPAAKRVLAAQLRSETISPHNLRHTCAVARLSAFVEGGMEMKLALQLLRSFFGWSPTSDMPQHYARAMFEDRLKSFWRGKLNDRTEFMRQLAQLWARGGLHPGTQSTIEIEESI